MFKKRQARDTSTDNSTPKYEMEGNPCYEATAVKQTTDTHLYEAVRGGGDKWIAVATAHHTTEQGIHSVYIISSF